MKDLYIALSGATAAYNQLNTIANNVANSATTGYRENRVSFELAGKDGKATGIGAQYAKTGTSAYSSQDGELEVDNVSTHVALRGNAFFALEDGTYTRDGSFRIDGEGRLVTNEGTGVMVDGAPTQLDPTEQISIAGDGTITGSKSGAVGKLDAFSLAGAQPLGGNRWSGTPSEAPESVSFVQGALEGSNVDAMRGMVEMMEASRFFEAQQKAIQTSDEMRSRLNRIGGS